MDEDVGCHLSAFGENMSPYVLPSRLISRNLRPYLSSSRLPELTGSKGPAFINSNSLRFERSPSAFSDEHLWSRISGSSIDASLMLL
jgi:hypothetical protein